MLSALVEWVKIANVAFGNLTADRRLASTNGTIAAAKSSEVVLNIGQRISMAISVDPFIELSDLNITLGFREGV